MQTIEPFPLFPSFAAFRVASCAIGDSRWLQIVRRDSVTIVKMWHCER